MSDADRSPFHEGERAVQERLGVREDIEPWARKIVRDFLPDEHRLFYAQLPFLVAAARDESDRPWVTLLAGAPGFASSPDDRTLRLEATPEAGDALAATLEGEAELGLLGIEFDTRRRNRVNGRARPRKDGVLELQVDQAFGNCPQYIHEREWEPAPASRAPRAEGLDALDANAIAWIRSADTFFIGSGHQSGDHLASDGMDASHRGGEPGFVRVEDARTLVFPDYAGNNHFNTIGNLVADPRVGLLFVDFEGGGLLQLTGRATIDWDSPEVARFPGARRLVRISVDAIVRQSDALPIRWKAAGGAVRSLRIAEKRRESDDVTSFLLEPRDGGALPDFEPGQHLPIEVAVPGHGRQLRTYSLSAPPAADGTAARYRLTIKRETQGRVSRTLHDELEPGDLLSARAPAGDFVLRPGARPVVLVSAGVGITPMTSMLGRLADPEDGREVWFVHGARDGRHHPLAAEVRAHAEASERIHSAIAYSRPRPEDRPGVDYEREGRVDADWIASFLPTRDVDVYLCGPIAFMAGIREGLEAAGVPEAQIHHESFGPAAG